MNSNRGPPQVLHDFVKRSYEAWRAAPSDLLLASCAVHQANVMAGSNGPT